MNSNNIDEKVEVARIGGAAVGVTLYGMTLNEWVAAATLLYLGVQILILAPKAFKTIRDIKQWIKK